MITAISASPQATDKEMVSAIFDDALTSTQAYENLRVLCEETPGRLIGSEASLEAQEIMKIYFERMGADKVWMQEFTSPAWRCDSAYAALVISDSETYVFKCDALGPSPSTEDYELLAQVVEVQSLEEVKELGRDKIEGKIVFYNRPWDHTKVNTFSGYGNMVDQRTRGPAVAAEMGAAGVLVRSVTNSMDYHPHTGSTRYGEIKIPAVAISTMDADYLSEALKKNPDALVQMYIDAEDLEEITTYNLIAEITGHEFPDEYIVVGGHMDAWHNTPGAHDDGAGCVMSADVLRIFKELGIENRHTIRAVMYMDEELYQSGGKAYAEYVQENDEKHVFALEADGGAFAPRQFTIDGPIEVVEKLASYQPLLKPYGICEIRKGWGGVDIGPLKDLDVALSAYGTDSQRYFDLHHSPNDTFDKINLRELQLGCGNMAAFIYLVDRYGF
jgi:hypothetical protein